MDTYSSGYPYYTQSPYSNGLGAKAQNAIYAYQESLKARINDGKTASMPGVVSFDIPGSAALCTNPYTSAPQANQGSYQPYNQQRVQQIYSAPYQPAYCKPPYQYGTQAVAQPAYVPAMPPIYEPNFQPKPGRHAKEQESKPETRSKRKSDDATPRRANAASFHSECGGISREEKKAEEKKTKEFKHYTLLATCVISAIVFALLGVVFFTSNTLVNDVASAKIAESIEGAENGTKYLSAQIAAQTSIEALESSANALGMSAAKDAISLELSEDVVALDEAGNLSFSQSVARAISRS